MFSPTPSEPHGFYHSPQDYYNLPQNSYSYNNHKSYNSRSTYSRPLGGHESGVPPTSSTHNCPGVLKPYGYSNTYNYGQTSGTTPSKPSSTRGSVPVTPYYTSPQNYKSPHSEDHGRNATGHHTYSQTLPQHYQSPQPDENERAYTTPGSSRGPSKKRAGDYQQAHSGLGHVTDYNQNSRQPYHPCAPHALPSSQTQLPQRPLYQHRRHPRLEQLSRSDRRRSLPMPEKKGPIPDDPHDDPHVRSARDLYWSSTNTDEFREMVKQFRVKQEAPGYNPMATSDMWNRFAEAEFQEKCKQKQPEEQRLTLKIDEYYDTAALERKKRRKGERPAGSPRGILKEPRVLTPELLKALPGMLLNDCEDCGEEGPGASPCKRHRRKRQRSAVDDEEYEHRYYNYKDPKTNTDYLDPESNPYRGEDVEEGEESAETDAGPRKILGLIRRPFKRRKAAS
ncbi:hypothetical protein CJU89_6406 [Yarrowia sp. B02]|nr:hypothetical protein CJU89_6406 [Yarrowia sp. B02]